jgi:hypothetical protein
MDGVGKPRDAKAAFELRSIGAAACLGSQALSTLTVKLRVLFSIVDTTKDMAALPAWMDQVDQVYLSVSLPSSRDVSHPFLVYVSIMSTAERCAPSLHAGARRGRSSSRKTRRGGGWEEGKAAVVGAFAMVAERRC